MPASDLSRVAVEAMRLQNGYALAIDARDWELFRTVFTPDVRADYPHSTFEGMEAWLENFIPFHDTCAWTVHEITNQGQMVVLYTPPLNGVPVVVTVPLEQVADLLALASAA